MTASKKIRKQIDALITTHNALCQLKVSPVALDAVITAIEELEDAFIAEANHENSIK